MLEGKALILAKIEGAYGVDPTPAAATDAILCSAPSIEILGASRERNVVLPYYGKLPPIAVGEGIKISFEAEIRGSGVATTPPRIGPLLRACNLTQTIGGSYVDYDPNSSESGESVAIYFHRDAIRHKLLGGVGSCKIGFKASEIGKISFEVTGLYAGGHAADIAFPTPTFGDSATPPIFKSASFAIQSYAALISALNLDLGNAIAKRIEANVDPSVYRYFIGGRAVKGDCDPEAVALATFNPWTLWNAGTAGTLTATVGSSAGNRCIVSSPSLVLDTPKYGAREGILAHTLGFSCHPTLTAGDNEIKIRFN